MGGSGTYGVAAQLDSFEHVFERLADEMQTKEERLMHALLQSMREAAGKEAIFKRTGRPDLFSKAKILRPFMHGEGISNGISIKVCDPKARDEIQKAVLRILRIGGEALHSPHRWELEEQPFDKFEDALLVLSYSFASLTGRLGGTESKAALQHLWEGLVSHGFMLQASDSIQETWQSLDCAWKRSIALTPFNAEPPIPRIIFELPDRVHRISVLGNGVVPLQAMEAFKSLMGL
jgi:hypothetical protein